MCGFWNYWFFNSPWAKHAAPKTQPAGDIAIPNPQADSPTDPKQERTDVLSEDSQRIRDAFYEHFQLADYWAVCYMECYRSAFAAAYLLGGIAVLCAVLAFARLGSAQWTELAFAGMELLAVWAIWHIYRRAEREQWHTRAVDYRLLAEMFRHTGHLALVGAVLPDARLPEHWRGGAHRGLWVYWYYSAMVRDLDFGLRRACNEPGGTLVIDDRYTQTCRSVLATDWIGNQAEYHAKTSRHYALLEWRLERLCLVLFAMVAASCIVHLLLPIVTHFVGHSTESRSVAGPVDWHDALRILLLCIGATAPALAAGFHAISKQAETSRLAESYERMEVMLHETRTRLDRLPQPVSLSELTAIAHEAAELMLGEVEDWQTAYRFHAVTTV